MVVQGITPVLPVASLGEATAYWSGLLGTEPTFVDGERWAQFDVSGRRLALAAADWSRDRAGVMVKVDDIEAAHAELLERGAEPSAIQTGAHERRFELASPGGWAVAVYAPLPA